MIFFNFLRTAYWSWRFICGFVYLTVPRICGLQTGKSVSVGRGIEWPLGNLKKITIGDNVGLGKRGWFYIPINNRRATIEIGSGTEIGNDFVIASHESIKIGRECLFSFRVSVMDQTHKFGLGINPVMSGISQPSPVVIGDRCYIGCNVVIMPGVKLGENCVVGANSVVTKSFEAGSVIAGAPAKLLRKLS